jgi:hypothetical protein
MEKAIAGPLAGKSLKRLPSSRTSWKRWKKRNPHTLVLSKDTGYNRDYSVDPYKGYYRSLGIWFPVGDVRRDLSSKERILGIEINGEARAYPISRLKTKTGVVKDKIGGKTIHIEMAPDGEVIGAKDEEGKQISPVFTYWFAWQAFHPETTVYGGKK